TADRNRSHWSTSKTPSYTKSVSWQHHQQNEFNIFLLRNQKLLPLSSVGISRVQQDEYYVAFGALSLNSSLDDVVLEMTTLAENALDLAEITEEYTHE
ncbi:DUF2170 family protein, partial [Citrobacter sp. Cpo089]|uniref:DUF2170 family protein n=1 Tax=Citrobacter sp. Cpo089 TaxID=2985138 RepID=UPI0025774119